MPSPAVHDPQLLLIPEVADLARVSIATVRYWIASGRLPSLRPGRRVLVRLAALQKFLADAERGAKTASSPSRRLQWHCE
jgi:excisionase family DNA binding protein